MGGVYYCIHQTSDACDCKKPKTALFHQAVRGRSVSFGETYFIGDSEEDIEAGKALGCITVLVLSGRATEPDISKFLSKPDVVKKNLLDAAHWIIQQKKF